MKTSELRIGNWINNCDKDYVIDHNTFINILDCEKVTGLFFWKPKPLTEEWLGRLGFEKSSEGYWSNGKLEVGFTTTDENIQYEYISVTYKTEMTDLKYVHQLQNLYFALTGEELTIKQ